MTIEAIKKRLDHVGCDCYMYEANYKVFEDATKLLAYAEACNAYFYKCGFVPGKAFEQVKAARAELERG